MDSYTQPNLESSALISIDMQNDFTLTDAPACIEGTQDAVSNLARVLALYQKARLPIVHVVRLYRPDGSNADLCRKTLIEEGERIVAPGTYGAELVESIKPQKSTRLDADLLISGGFQQIASNEYVMYKPRWGAFYGTDFEGFLKSRKVDTLVFAGCNFPNCPRTSIYEASERNFRIALVCDAVSRLSEKDEEEMRAIAVTLTTAAKLQALFTRQLRSGAVEK